MSNAVTVCILSSACSLFAALNAALSLCLTLSEAITHTCSSALLITNQSIVSHLVSPLHEPLLSSFPLPVCHFAFMQDLPALYLELITCCHPWLFFTNSTCQIPGKSLRLLFLTMSLITASSGFCLWLFGILLPVVCVSSLPVGLSVLKTVL